MRSMVSFYGYAFLKVKDSPLLLILLLTFGYHNNAYGNGDYTLIQNGNNPFLNKRRQIAQKFISP